MVAQDPIPYGLSDSEAEPQLLLLAWDRLQFLAMWASPYSSLLHQSQQRRMPTGKVCKPDSSYILCKVITDEKAYPLCCILLVKSKPQVPPTLKGRGLHRSVNARGDNHPDFRICVLVAMCICYKDCSNVRVPPEPQVGSLRVLYVFML